VLEEHIYEEIYQEYLDEVSHAEDPNETLVFTFPLEENEVVQPFEEVTSSSDTGEFMEQPSEKVDNHIDDFICVQKRGWDISCFNFDGDPIYKDEGRFQTKNAEIFPLEDCFSYVGNQDIWQPNDDMITYYFYPSEDDLPQCTHDDFHSYLESHDAYSFKHSYLLYDEDFPPSLCSNFDEHETLVSLEQSETHTMRTLFSSLGFLQGFVDDEATIFQ
jgi:hypothetical protein